MSQRKPGTDQEESARRRADPPSERPPRPLSTLLVQAGLLLAVFALVTLVADLAGAANLGVALGIGQIAFAVALVYVLLRH